MKKGISSVMFMIVIIILGLLALTFGFLFFGTTGEIQEKFDIFAEATEPSCSEKCVLEGYRSGSCIEMETIECVSTYTGFCEGAEICCCGQ
jgi:hypothetical protein